MGLILHQITPSNIGFESFVVAATPLPMKSAAAGPPMRLQRTMSKEYMKWCMDYLEKGKTINSEYYCALLERLKAEIAAKRPHMKRKKNLFSQDNAPAHKSIATTAKINDLKLQLLPHPPY